MNQFNDLASTVYNRLITNKITINEYRDYWDSYAQKNPEVLKNFRQRKDNRTLGEFAVELITSKQYEQDIINKWITKCNMSDLGSRIYGVSPISCIFNGVEESGQLVLQNGNRKKFKKADYLILPLRKPLEIKHNPSIAKITFKINDLSYYKKENADILIEMGGKFLTYFTVQQYSDILVYAQQNDKIDRMREMGWKPCCQLYIDKKCSLNKCAMDISLFSYTRINL